MSKEDYPGGIALWFIPCVMGGHWKLISLLFNFNLKMDLYPIKHWQNMIVKNIGQAPRPLCEIKHINLIILSVPPWRCKTIFVKFVTYLTATLWNHLYCYRNIEIWSKYQQIYFFMIVMYMFCPPWHNMTYVPN